MEHALVRDNSDRVAVDVLAAVAEADRHFKDLALKLRSRPDVREVLRVLDFSQGPSFDFTSTRSWSTTRRFRGE